MRTQRTAVRDYVFSGASHCTVIPAAQNGVSYALKLGLDVPAMILGEVLESPKEGWGGLGAV